MSKTKEQQIVSQSTLKLVNEFSNNCGYCLTLKDLVTISLVLEEYIENGYTKELGGRLDKVDAHLSAKYGKV
jgi:hypothetical protein